MNKSLNFLNDIAEKKYSKELISLRTLPEDERIKIHNFMRKSTKFGQKTMLELESHVVFLPEKYTLLPDDGIGRLLSKQSDDRKRI